MKQGEQKSTRELEVVAMNVETFNPQWHDGEFLGPSSMRQETNTKDNAEDEHKTDYNTECNTEYKTDNSIKNSQ